MYCYICIVTNKRAVLCSNVFQAIKQIIISCDILILPWKCSMHTNTIHEKLYVKANMFKVFVIRDFFSEIRWSIVNVYIRYIATSNKWRLVYFSKLLLVLKCQWKCIWLVDLKFKEMMDVKLQYKKNWPFFSWLFGFSFRFFVKKLWKLKL